MDLHIIALTVQQISLTKQPPDKGEQIGRGSFPISRVPLPEILCIGFLAINGLHFAAGLRNQNTEILIVQLNHGQAPPGCRRPSLGHS